MRGIGLVFLPLALFADPGADFFEKHIRPVLADRCYACHSAQVKTPMGGLRLDTAETTRKGGDSGPLFIPGDPARSLLLDALRYASLRLRMPPTGKLTDEQIAHFERWISMGAPDPRSSPSTPAAKTGSDWRQARDLWSLQPLKNPSVPPVKEASWLRSPVDAFLLAKLEARSLTPAPPAAKRDWIRRVTFDLTGLPPAPTDVDAYLRDASPDSQRRVVDRLLASPHYGERWARHWLDLVRFAETNGHEFDNEKLDAWRYRDYVIRALNNDVPYDQFVREHIAGDLLPAKRLSPDGAFFESPLATGAYWFGEVLNSATDSVKTRADTVDNQIDVLSKAFLGLTVACARCHDHKFDPIPTADYYALAGVMHSTYVREAVVDSTERAAEIARLHREIGALNERIRQFLPQGTPSPAPAFSLREGEVLFEDFEGPSYSGWFSSGEAFGSAPSRAAAPNQNLVNYRGEGMANSFGLGTDRLVGSLTSGKFKMPKLWVHVRLSGTKGTRGLKETEPLRLTVVADDHKSEHFVSAGKPGFHWQSIRMTKEIGRICYFELVDRSRTGHIAIDKILFSDNDKPPEEPDVAPPAPAGVSAEFRELEKERAALEDRIPESVFGLTSMDDSPHNVRLHIRGSHQNLGDEVPRGFLRALAGEDHQFRSQDSGRLELAEWMVRNPLTPRVAVNRIWKHHFGQGLVRSADNFGKLGQPPLHNDLLDWLAASFVENRWSIKQLHRTIVLSSAYAMSSEGAAAARESDAANTLFHHVPVQRLEAEAIRDSLLAVSGKLDPALYGPSVMPHISPYQDGRGKPRSGPLDGKGRRSIYLQVRRNFLPPMFLAFDYPLPVSTTGARGVSTVPSQALILMNNEFVAESAKSWASRLVRETTDARQRLETMFAEAFARPPEDWEVRESLAFLDTQRTAFAGKTDAEQRAWADLCHVLFNSTEFVYVR